MAAEAKEPAEKDKMNTAAKYLCVLLIVGISSVPTLHHDKLDGFITNEHIDHSLVSITAGTGISGGGTILADRTISLSHLGLEALTDPGADRVLWWDDSPTGALAWKDFANWDTAYTHSQDNTQAHSDYLINNGNDSTSGELKAAKFLVAADTYIDEDGSDNMTFTDAVVGTRTLKQLGCPTYKYIKAISQSEGDLDLSDGTNWAVSKAMISAIRVVTSSTDWDLYILQNDNGYSTDDATIPKLMIAYDISGNANLLVNVPFEDEDASSEVHLYYIDNSGANTADIYIIGYELL